jgi:glycosyltransferase involved in cell wall biosynthesis
MIKPKVAYFTNIAPHYREKLWLAFARDLGVEFHFYYGNNSDKSIKSVNFKNENWKGLENQVHVIDNIKVKNRLIYQRHVLKEVAFKHWDVIILLGDANILSNWLAAIVAWLKGIPVIFWGHGIYGSESFLKRIVRKSFLSLSNINLVYGHWARNLLIEENFQPVSIRVIYNSINYEISKPLRKKAIIFNFYYKYFKNDLPTLIFIGRLTRVKRLYLLIEAVHKLNTNPKKFNLMIIGNGEVKEDLKSLAKKLKVDAYFFGACYEEEKISEFMSNADLCVSPGNVGLTSIHAMSYGTPVCTNNDFKNQMPEFEAIKPWKTGCFFDKEKGDLVETISKWFEKSPSREKVRTNCYDVVDNFYNPNMQLEVLRKAIKDLTK